MFYIGNNKFPLKNVLCCIGNKASKKMVDLKVLMTCGPEIMKAVGTFFLTNIPLISFALYTHNFFWNDAYNLNNNNFWRILISIQIMLIPVVNVLFVLAAATDPGIIPARNWTNSK